MRCLNNQYIEKAIVPASIVLGNHSLKVKPRYDMLSYIITVSHTIITVMARKSLILCDIPPHLRSPLPDEGVTFGDVEDLEDVVVAGYDLLNGIGC